MYLLAPFDCMGRDKSSTSALTTYHFTCHYAGNKQGASYGKHWTPDNNSIIFNVKTIIFQQSCTDMYCIMMPYHRLDNYCDICDFFSTKLLETQHEPLSLLKTPMKTDCDVSLTEERVHSNAHRRSSSIRNSS